jgi:hypothetical protein
MPECVGIMNGAYDDDLFALHFHDVNKKLNLLYVVHENGAYSDFQSSHVMAI